MKKIRFKRAAPKFGPFDHFGTCSVYFFVLNLSKQTHKKTTSYVPNYIFITHFSLYFPKNVDTQNYICVERKGLNLIITNRYTYKLTKKHDQKYSTKECIFMHRHLIYNSILTDIIYLPLSRLKPLWRLRMLKPGM